MRVLGVIPARYASTRFPGKMLANIFGKPLVLWTYDSSKRATMLDHLIIATDDERIADIAEMHGADVMMTSQSCRNGTERVAEVAKKLRIYDLVVNIQGDEPLISGNAIDALVMDMIAHPDAGMGTLSVPITSQRQLRSPDVVKVVRTTDDTVLYFSRSPIPYRRNGIFTPLRHIGVYAYRWEALMRVSLMEATPLEREEGLEQMRALECGIKIRCINIPDETNLIAIDRPEDIEKFKRTLKKRMQKK